MSAPIRYVLLGLAVVATPAFGAGALSSDRPGFSTAPYTVAPGSWQLEAGYLHAESDDGRTDREVIPEAVLRTGIAGPLELNLAMNGYVRTERGGSSESGIGDFAMGFKAGTATTSVGNFGALARVTLPTGDAPGTVDDPGLTAALLWDRGIRPGTSLFGTLQADFADAFGDSTTTWTPAIGVSTTLVDRLGGFVEYYAQIPEEGDTAHTVDLGLTWLATADLQLDFHLGAGLNDEAEDFAGFGLAHRF